jgi:hypothetical protein
METYSNPTSRAVQRYYWQFGLSMAAYVIVILLSRWMWHNANGRWQTVVALFPMIPAVFVFASIVRYLLATDELLRRIAVVSLALAGGATALIAVTYGLLEGDGLPRPSAWWTYGVFMVSWIISSYFVRRRHQ